VEEIFIFIAIFVSVRDNEALKNLSPKFKQILCIQNSFQLLLFAFCQMQEWPLTRQATWGGIWGICLPQNFQNIGQQFWHLKKLSNY